MLELGIAGGVTSKIINDFVDALKKAYKDANKRKKEEQQNLQTRVYQVIIDSLDAFTGSKYSGQGVLSDAAECILNGFRREGISNVKIIGPGFGMLGLSITDDTCEKFLETMYYEICKDKNDDLRKEISLYLQVQGIDNDKELLDKTDCIGEYVKSVKEDVNYIKEKLDSKEDSKKEYYREIIVENRAEEYAKKWDKNVFLNDFNKRDKNSGVNIKLKELYLDEQLPHYIWKAEREPYTDLKELLKEYIVDIAEKKMLLILGQAGIGKSTLITWIVANFKEKQEDILVYQFASDLKDVDWQGEDMLDHIMKTFGLRYDALENKTLILDGFDEINASSDRGGILNQLCYELKTKNYLKRFSLIITCRENYVYNLGMLKCDYIILQAWDFGQIQSFCETYGNVSRSNIRENTIRGMLENKWVFGIPLILYMVLALDITVNEYGSIVDIYDKIFSLDGGGIYDRCIKNLNYASPHRISIIKRQIHQVSQRIAFWIFENNPEKAFIFQKDFKKICDAVVNESEANSDDLQNDVLIGNYFKYMKHCEGIGTEELQFVHRSLYEYFVAVYFYESICNLETKEEVAGKLGEFLKVGHLSEQILKFINNKFACMKQYNLFGAIKTVFNVMLRDGMTYHMGKSCKNAIEREINIFVNMLEIMQLWSPALGKLDDKIIIYLQINKQERLKLNGIELEGLDLSGVYLKRANIKESNLKGANLKGANLIGANLIGANLIGANLGKADLSRADLRGADLKETYLRKKILIKADSSKVYLNETDLRRINLRGANLKGTIFGEEEVGWLSGQYDLSSSRIYLAESGEVISYKEYCARKKRS